MKRVSNPERVDATKIVQGQGLVYTSDNKFEADGITPNWLYKYWTENAHYEFTSEEIALMETAVAAVFDMCEKLGDMLVLPENQWRIEQQLAVPHFAVKQVVETWNRESWNVHSNSLESWGSVYGRFDLRFGGLDHPDPEMRIPKIYEFNADTPTSLVESAAIQWFWLEQTGFGQDQWNSLDERLVAAWQRNMYQIEQKLGHKPVVYFAASSEQTIGEDVQNTILMAETCAKAGYETRTIYMEQIEMDDKGRFFDPDMQHIDVIFKLFPWEHLVLDEFGEAAFEDMERVAWYMEGEYAGGTIWIEPPYKMLWSNKGLMALLWEMFGNSDHPGAQFLLPTWFEGEAPQSTKGYAKKPLLSREGADITLFESDGSVIAKDIKDEYGSEGFILQELALPPVFQKEDGKEVHPVLGVWMVDGEPAGMGIRESSGAITDDFANFVPHSIVDGERTYAFNPVPMQSLQSV